MKFSNTLEATMLPEWRQHYINYKALKKVLKQVRTAAAALHDHHGPAWAMQPVTVGAVPLSASRLWGVKILMIHTDWQLQHHQESLLASTLGYSCCQGCTTCLA